MEIDHVVLGASSVEETVELLAPVVGEPAFRSRHPELGSENAIWVPPDGPYLEVLAGSFIAEPGTLHLAWAAPDRETVAHVAARLRALGAHAPDPVDAWGTAPDGRRRTWTFCLTPRSLGGAADIVIHHHGWDWRRELAAPTKVARVVRVEVAALDPERRRAELEEALGGLPPEVEVVPAPADGVAAVDLALADGSVVPFR